MRKTVYSLLKDSVSDVVPAERWYQMGAVDNQPIKPFGVYRLSGTLPGVTSRSKSRPARLEVWVHDDPGSYTQIDGALSRIEDLLDAVVHVSSAPGESISQITYGSRSPDLNDDGFGSICRMSSFTLIGKGQ